MPVTDVRGVDDPRLAPYRDVPDAELMHARGLFVAEGRLVVRRVIEDGRFRVRSVLVNEAAARDLAPVLDALPPATPIFIRPPIPSWSIVWKGSLPITSFSR